MTGSYLVHMARPVISSQQFHALASCLGLSRRTAVLVCLFRPEFPEVLQLSMAQGHSLLHSFII